MKELNQTYRDILEENDWSISSYIDGGRVEVQKYSPAGEDFSMCVEVENFPESVREYANDFDANEHVEMWIKARGIVSGVPESIRELIDDAEEIQKMLNELADALEGKNIENSMEELKQYRENSYYDTDDISERLIELSNLDPSEEMKTELDNALYALKAAAQNQYNKDYYKVLYNVLLVITGMEVF